MPQGLLHTPTDDRFLSRRNSNRGVFSRINFIFISIFLFCCFVYFILYLFFLPSQVILDNQYGKIAEEVVNERYGYKFAKIDEQCSQVTGTCYVIVDKKVEQDNGEFVERNMLVKGFHDDSDTVVRLIPPRKEASFDVSDTRIWKVDHFSIPAQYVAALLSAPFIVSTFSLVDRDNDGKSILEIGLGGGSVDMFMHQLNPNVNITAVELDPTVAELSKKWFGVVEDSTRRTVVADGLKFIEAASKNGHKYDVVIIDACDTSTDVPCPASVFRTTKVVEQLFSIVAENGVLVVNILSYEDKTTKESEKIIELLTTSFNTCMILTLKKEINVIPICTHHTISESPANLEFLKKRADAVTMRLGLQNVLSTINFSG